MDGYSIKAVLSLQDKNFTSNMNKAKGAAEEFESTAQKSGKAAASSFTASGKSAKGMAGGINAAKAGFSTLKTSAVNAYNTIKSSSSKVQGVKDVFSKVAAHSKGQFAKMRSDGILSATGIKGAFQKLGGGLKGIFSRIGSSFKSVMSSLLSGVVLGGLIGMGQSVVSAIGNSIRSMGSQIVEVSKAWANFRSNMEASGHAPKFIKDTQKELQDYAATTIYKSSAMASTFAQLDAVGTKGTVNIVKGLGAIAATAENPEQAMKSMSTQVTQMAAKPTVAWQDFKIMLEQAPAGMARVAEKMGMSTKELVASVQDGKIKTNDLFKALRVAGQDKSLQKVATQYKSIGAAADGVKSTLVARLVPAYEVLSKVAIKNLAKIQFAFADIKPEKLAEGMKKLISFAAPMFQALGGAISSVVKYFQTMASSFDKASNGAFSKVVGSIKTVITAFASLMSKLYQSEAAMSLAKTAGFLLGNAFKAFGTVIEWIANFISDLCSDIETMIDWLNKGKKALTEFFKGEGLTKARDAGLLSGSEYTAGLNTGLTRAKAVANKTSHEAAAALKSGDSFGSGTYFGTGFIGGVRGQTGGAVGAAGSMGASAKTRLKTSSSGTASSGSSFGQGFINGMRSKLGAIAVAARSLGTRAVNSLSSRIKEGSPSKLTRKSGGYFGEGFALGIKDKARQVQRTAADLVNIPKLQMSRMAYASAFSSELSEAFDYNVSASYEVTVPVNLNGREVARVIAGDVSAEQGRTSSFESRKRGIL